MEMGAYWMPKFLPPYVRLRVECRAVCCYYPHFCVESRKLRISSNHALWDSVAVYQHLLEVKSTSGTKKELAEQRKQHKCEGYSCRALT
jgi:hypothetical protein